MRRAAVLPRLGLRLRLRHGRRHIPLPVPPHPHAQREGGGGNQSGLLHAQPVAVLTATHEHVQVGLTGEERGGWGVRRKKWDHNWYTRRIPMNMRP